MATKPKGLVQRVLDVIDPPPAPPDDPPAPAAPADQPAPPAVNEPPMDPATLRRPPWLRK